MENFIFCAVYPLECRNNQAQSVKVTEDNQTNKIVRTRDDIHKEILDDEDLSYTRHQPKRKAAEEANDKISG